MAQFDEIDEVAHRGRAVGEPLDHAKKVHVGESLVEMRNSRSQADLPKGPGNSDGGRTLG